MKNIWLPDRIRSAVRGKTYEKDETGMSGSQIFLFEDMVLKIQEASRETENEAAVCNWLAGRLPVPEILEYIVSGDKAYCLMTRIKGKMLCDDEYMTDPERLTELAVQALKMLWAVEIRDCPCDNSLDVKLQMARFNVEHNLVDMDHVEPDTFGENGFRSPMELLCWLEEHRPEETFSFSHGDFCLPNIFAEGDKVTGFIDLGKMGIADPWDDIAICDRSLRDNFEGIFQGSRAYEGYSSEMLFQRLGIKEDREKREYYVLLDELF